MMSPEAQAAWSAYSKGVRALHEAALEADRGRGVRAYDDASAELGQLRLAAERATGAELDPGWAALRDAQEAVCSALADADPGRGLAELEEALAALPPAPKGLMQKSVSKVRRQAAEAAARVRARISAPPASAAATLAQWDAVLALVDLATPGVEALGPDAGGALRAARMACGEVRARISRRVRT
ncbi:MAG: hypothetical protein A2Y78_00020 [Acidobacteria bacterium RBG_13_68_16]|nr:MAG: hypothetical protein A2Y78_00020 [Acidobacteria bacterium RBG_13_68_16]